ncbi:hypothetical protein BKA67DRAFT_583369 [Truncatella angustata]|uniref:Uncharacterized protein n=1 Tax=Truncatella angustata TaxID=152316 RepID=A0A9P8UC17_9PEZI|nr:uncharacterized protein BKA67DRAFT_583369 [Truncatella angustata]KAH6646146.1 hypothetical protein BKA67DRAFT_583369 [Truncatella angustata]
MSQQGGETKPAQTYRITSRRTQFPSISNYNISSFMFHLRRFFSPNATDITALLQQTIVPLSTLQSWLQQRIFSAFFQSLPRGLRLRIWRAAVQPAIPGAHSFT